MDEKRIEELANRARAKNIYVFTNFISLQTQQEISKKYPQDFIQFFGGVSFAERKIARFGTDCFEQDYPLSILQIHSLNRQFSTTITHRDILGALMALQITREKVGDIFIGEDSFVILHNSVAEFVADNIVSVGKNNVQVQFVQSIPQEYAPQKEQITISATSNRLDAILSRVYNLSRDKAMNLVEMQKVAINGIPCEKGTHALKNGETVSVRGLGKFEFVGECGTSKKGKTYFSILLFK